MATTYEKTSEGIIYKPSRTRKVPQVDLMTLLFGTLHNPFRQDTLIDRFPFQQRRMSALREATKSSLPMQKILRDASPNQAYSSSPGVPLTCSARRSMSAHLAQARMSSS